MRSARYLDQLRQAKGFTNDTELADFLGVKQNTISQYRHAKGFMSNEVCLKVAAGLDMDSPLSVIMAADMDRAEKTGQQSLWEVFLPRMAGVSAALLLGIVTNFVTPSPAQAAPALENGANAVYLM